MAVQVDGPLFYSGVLDDWPQRDGTGQSVAQHELLVANTKGSLLPPKAANP